MPASSQSLKGRISPMRWLLPIIGFASLSAAIPSPQYSSSTHSHAKRWGDLVQRHSWPAVPKGWKFHSDVPEDYKMTLRIGLKQHRFDALANTLFQISDPSHTRYGAHLSKSQVESLVAPHATSVSIIDDWLRGHGIDLSDSNSVSRSSGGDWITVEVTMPQVEEMLNAKYGVYSYGLDSDSKDASSSNRDYVVRTLAYSLPQAVHDHITVISPTTYFGTWRSMRATSFVDTTEVLADVDQNKLAVVTHDGVDIPVDCITNMTPDCLRRLYNIWYKPQATHLNKLGIVGYLGEFGNRADLQIFYERYMPSALGTSYNTTLVNGGGDDQSKPGREANLDIQYAVSISYPTPNIYYSVGGSPPFIPDSRTVKNTNEPYLEWLHWILALKDEEIPKTITTSYGDDEQTVPYDYQITVCNLFAQLGARGVSILFSSGDVGVGGGDCMTNDGSNKKRFQPGFPGTCPFVTTVGSTTHIPERVVNFSSGGFSNTFPRPSYQDAAVSTYLQAIGGMYSGLYNASGRGVPDIAAQGTRFKVILGGETKAIGGTSASTPVVAAMIALINDYRLANKKPTLGFLNPMLYSENVTRVLNDVTEGSNPGCGTTGFPAREGWDPATGLGTPDFLRLLATLG
ncbi:hypothetical protein PC9H_011136 [Pleurotus ostreatus]|uniref:tripeptidyl-peptidase II n=1 Tax=Pleurotus ostreatus TaxID=5322 RepID=A0A8H6ZL41_PLEOS|nr:uncharacterized protein PC9H_011136 [Pleurotus ostreatus]KAF7422972.1 hypothetical protein PC9H_011136 [Pleurotus ostreatus]